MSWGLFIGGIMAGFFAAWVVAEKIKYDAVEKEWEAREINVPKTYEPVVVTRTMTEEEFNTKMDALFEIFAIQQ